MRKNTVFQTGAVAEAWATAPPHRQPDLLQRILVVDDDPLIRQLNREVLSYSGYEVDAAVNGAAAWDALLANNYHLLITDNDLPQVTGVDLLKRVHATRMAMPVVLATATFPARELSQCPWLQPAAVLMKPYSFDELVETVQKVLRATASAPAEMAPPPSGQEEPPHEGLRL
jgi:DNA-binding response OmpR family regulator